MKNFINKIKEKIPYLRGKFFFKNSNDVYLENYCQIEKPKWLKLKGNNKIYRGTVILPSYKNSIEIGENSNIHRYTILQDAGGFIKIGSNTNIGDFCFLTGQGGLTIGDDVLCSSYSKIIPNEHEYKDINMPIWKQSCISKGVSIGNGTWIGIGVTILDGVNIGKHCILGGGRSSMLQYQAIP